MGTIDRRSFLTGALTGGGALAAAAAGFAVPGSYAYADEWRQAEQDGTRSNPARTWSFMEPPEPISEDQVGETIDCDIVIVGCGVAAGPATMYAAEIGADVHVIEKGSGYGNKRFGTCCFNSKFQQEAGIRFDRERMMRDGYRVSGGYISRLDLWGMFFDYSGPLMDYVKSRVEESGITMIPAVTSPETVEIDGETYLSGTTSDQFWNGDQGFCQFANMDPENMAYPEWLHCMYDHAKEYGATFHFSCPGKQLITDDDGNVTGIYAYDQFHDHYIRFNTAKGVLLATGGMEGDKEMVERYCPVLLQKTVDWSMVELKDTGDGHKMGLWVGAALDDNIGQGYWPYCTVKDTTKIRPAGWPQGAQLYWAPSLSIAPGLHTNIAGERYQNEALPFTFSALGSLSQPEGKDWSIWDGAWQQKISPVMPQTPQGGQMVLFCMQSQSFIDKEVELGITMKADTIEELAEICGFDPEVFKDTVDRYNAMCDAGEDTEFLKEAKWMTKIDTPPYYAAQTVTSTTGTIGGLKYDKHMRVVNTQGRPIKGLYAAGTCSGNFYSSTYPGNIVGCAMGHGQTFAALAIRDMMGIDFGDEYPA